MKPYRYFLFILFIACNNTHTSPIRKIPCEKVVEYNNMGALNGKYFTYYYAVNDNQQPAKELSAKMRATADAVFQQTGSKKYAGAVCWFLKESEALQKISDCAAKDGNDISSDEHEAIAMFTFNAQSNKIEEMILGPGDQRAAVVYPVNRKEHKQ